MTAKASKCLFPHLSIYAGEARKSISIKIIEEKYHAVKSALKNLITFTAMTEEMDDILFDEIRNGNEKVFNKAFDRYYSCLCFYTDKILHDFDMSRSIVQQVFVDLWIKRDKLHIDSLKSYLYQSVRNASLDVLKHKKAELKYLSTLQKTESDPFTDLVEEAELADKINRAIHKLPDKCREIFMLCRFEELKYAEIADRLNISVKTVEMQICIALKRLRLELADPSTN